MLLNKIGIMALIFFGSVMAAHANEVLLISNQPVKIAYRLAYKKNNQINFGALQTVEVNRSYVHIPVSLDNYDRVGVVIVAANEHELPPSDNQFDQPDQCSMTTDKEKDAGVLEFVMFDKNARCVTYGGVFK